MKSYSNDQLQAFWEKGFEDRVKSGKAKGQIRIRTIKFSTKVLAEATRRGITLVTPAKYQ